MGDADLMYLKTNAELTKTLARLAARQQPEQQQSSSQEQQSFELAKRESAGFFTDISDTAWNMLKLKAAGMQPNTRGDPRRFTDNNLVSATWFQNHYEPDFACALERRIGRLGDGGKWICDPHRITMKAQQNNNSNSGGDRGCLVYSVGSNGDASFEAAILQDVSPDCEIHVFDFGDYAASVQQQTQPSVNVHYHQWGISDVTKGRFKTLQDTVQELGHAGRTIDIFKIDCEGCEIDTFAAWFDADVVLRQILVEVHYQLTLSRPTWWHKMHLPETVDMFERIYKEGYVITHKEPYMQHSETHGKGICVEYAFLLLSPSFWTNKVEVSDVP